MRKVKLKAGEDLSPLNIIKVMEYLEEDKSTKKKACEILGISYNTSRLANIITEYTEGVDRDKRHRAKKRGKPIDEKEAAAIVEDYLSTGSMQAVSDIHYRSTALVKSTILKYGGDFLSPKTDYFDPQLLPDASMRKDFEIGEMVWSARYNCLAEVTRPTKDGTGYWVWVLGSCSQQSAQAVEELGSLEHLRAIGVNLNRVALAIYDDTTG